MNSSALRPPPSVLRRPFNLIQRLVFLGLTFWPAVVLIGVLEYATSAGVTSAAGALTIETLAGYNLVVDSNVESPSTYAPSVATVGGRFCNTGDQPLTDVSVYIGNYVTTPANSTPGIYPTRDSSTAPFIAEHAFLAGTGLYSFTHVGGSMGTLDARRYVGTLAPGECRVQYWHFTYPRRANPNNSGVAVWGDTNDPNDDLWLSFDLWGNSAEGITNNTTWTMTMRNEISAMANKIYPNGSSWFNTDTTTVRAGDVITSNGILYELGVINKGFDNDGDGEFDFNAWLQPIGDPSYDPSCFRLIGTSGIFTVSISAAPDLIIPFTDQLYFTDIPEANNGAIGNVYYTFLALNGPCFTGLSPYQEVASGADNEKFSGDYGTPGVPPVQSLPPQVSVDKSGNATVVLGSSITYQVASANTGTQDAGMPLISGGSGDSPPWVPLVYSDTIPAGLVYVAGSATHTFTSTGVIILYSTDSGLNWISTEPPASQVTTIQWWLTDTLKSGESGTVLFNATVPVTYPTSYVENCAGASFDGGEAFADDCALTLVQGTNRIGDMVWQDDDSDGTQDGGETGISNVTVNLYLDRDGDGTIDTNDLVVMTATTSITGFYQFTGLPNGNFLVQVNSADPDLPLGYGATTPTLVSVKNLGTTTPSPYTQADFGFGPSLRVDKTMLSTNPISESGLITYLLSLINTLPGDGTGSTACQYIVWASIAHPDNTLVPNGGTSSNAQWSSTGNALNTPNSLYAATNLNDNTDLLGLSGFNLGAQSGSITKVEALLYLNELVNLKDTDDLTFRLYMTDTVRGAADTFTGVGYFTQTVGSNYQLKIDVTSKHPNGSTGWLWGNFTGNTTEMQLEAGKGSGGGSSGDLGLDAAAFLITTNQTCGGPDTTIFTLPVTDTYDTARLQFISADPSPSLVSSGVISWANQGPLYAGQIKTIEVVFEALAPPTEANTVTTNTVAARNATFASGRAVNNATDLVTTTIIPTGSIGNFIWYDSDSDGVQDGGEVGIPNVTVRLCSNSNCSGGGNIIYATTTTDADGFYLFEGLGDGTYHVDVLETTLPGGSAGWTNTGDPDAGDPDSGESGPLTLDNTDASATNNDYLAVDFGYHSTGIMLFGNVWEDVNGNGLQTTGEDGFSGVSVAIWNCGVDTICFNGDDAAVVTTTTSANGDYMFTGLTAGTRYVRVITTTLPSGGTWINTADPESDFNSRSTSITLAAGNLYGAYDFGYHHSGTLSIGDTVYADWNGDGDQDTGEEGIPNITVSLYEDEDKDGIIDADDALITTTVTNASGVYTFANLAGSTGGLGYIVVVDTNDTDLPAGYLETEDPDETGVCATCDSQASVTLVASNVTDIDFGYQPTGGGSIGDFVWRDTDHDGIHDTGEPGLPNITVTLYEDTNGDGIYNAATDAFIATTTTDSGGNYIFENLPYGTGHHYLVDVNTADTDLPLDGYGQRYVLSTNNDPHPVHLTDSDPYEDADFGFSAGGTIGDLVWRDDNRDGDPDGEPGVSGVRVWLYIDNDNNGVQSLGDTLVATTTTSATGIYSFTSLAVYTYVVKLDQSTLPTTTLTYDLNGALDAQAQVGLRAGMIFLSVDFGVASDRGAIGDRIWIDENGDDIYQTYENGLSGIVVTLTSASGVTTTTTDADGYYLFPYLLTGTYTVTYNSASIPSGLAQTFEGDGTLNQQIVVNLANGQNYLTADFAYAPNLNVTKTSLGANNPLQAGDMLTYTIVISNPSSIGVTGSVLSDSLPANTNFVNGSGTISPASAGSVGSLPNLVNPLTVTANSAVTVTFRVTVTNPIPVGVTAITNTVLLTTTAGITDTDTVTNPVAVASPDLQITKTDGVTTTTPGATLVYTLTITNTGSGGATGVMITDTIPVNTTFVSASNSGVFGSGLVTWPTFSLPGSGAFTTRLVTVTVNNPLPAGTTAITNTATVADDGTNGADPTPGNNTTTDVDTITAAPDLTITKTDGVASTTPGSTLVYTLTVTNVGNIGATGVLVTDTIPVNTTFVSASNSGVFGSGLVTWPTFSLAGGGASITRFVTVTVNSPLPAGTTTITNTATVTDNGANGADPTPGNNTTTDVDTITAAPDLTITKTDGVASTTPGSTLVYTLTVTNVGNIGATGVLVTDTIPVNTTFVSASNSGVFGSGLVTWPAFSLAGGGAFITRLVTVTVNNPLPAGTTAITNTATVADDGTNGADPTPGNNTTTDVDTLTATPDLTITKTDGVGSTTPGATLGYTLTVTNVGNIGATGVLITDTIPVNTTFVAASNSGVFGSGLVTWPTFSLAGGGASVTRFVTVTVDNPLPGGTTAITNTVTVTDDGVNGADPTPGNNTATDVDSLTAAPDLTITKTDGLGSTGAGATLVYTLTVTNVGNIGATGVLVTDTIPADTTFVSASNSGVFGSGLVTWPSFSLAGGGVSVTRLVTVTVNNPLTAGTTAITNTATVTDNGTNGADPTPGNNTATDVDTLEFSPDLQITKTDGVGSTTPGATLVYTLTITNVGDIGVTGALVTDTLPANTTFVSASNSGVFGSGLVTWPAFSLAGGGAFTTRLVTITVNNPQPAGTTAITNTATVTDDGSNGSDPNPDDNTATDVDTLTAAPDLTITKTDGVATTTPGATLVYTLTITNVGNIGATGVLVTDTIPTNTAFDSASDSGVFGSGLVTWPTFSLAGGGASVTRFVTVTVDNPLPGGTTAITNTATVTDNGANGADPTPGNNTATDVDPVGFGTVSGHLYIDTNGDFNQDLGEPDLISVTVTITDSNGITQTVVTNGTGDWTATVPPGSTTADVDETDPQYPTGYTQTEGTDPTTVTAVAGTDTDAGNDGYFLSGTVSGHLYIDTNGDFNQDLGEPDLISVTVTITDSNGIVQTVVTNGNGDWTAIVPPGSTTADVDETDPQYPTGYTQTEGTDPTTVTAVAGTDTDAGNDGYHLSGTPDLQITKTDGVASTTPGATLVYTLRITNTGTITATGVLITDTIPANTTFVAASNSGVFGSGRVTWPTFSLAGGSAFTTRLVTVTVNSPLPAGVTAITNTATVTDDGSNGPDPTPVNNTTTDVDPVAAAPDLRISKTDGVASTTPGAMLIYTLTITNTGTQNATGVLVTDTIPANTTFVAASNSGVFGSGRVTWPAFSLAGGGASTTRLVTVTVNSPLPAGVTTITNTATVTDDGSNGPDPTPVNNTTTDVDPVAAAPDLRLTKSDGGVSPMPGGIITYTLNYTNTGTQAATGVVITETVPNNTHYNAAASLPTVWACPTGNPGTICTTNIPGSVAGGGGSGSVRFGVRVDNPLPGTVTSIVNTAIIGDDGTNGPDPTPINNTGTVGTIPTAVKLLYFKVNGVSGLKVTLGWATETEIDHYGFNLYRAPANNFSQATLIHFEPATIPGGNHNGATYQYADTVPTGGEWWYWLKDVDTQGRETSDGSVNAKVGVGPGTALFYIYLPMVNE